MQGWTNNVALANGTSRGHHGSEQQKLTAAEIEQANARKERKLRSRRARKIKAGKKTYQPKPKSFG